MTDDLLKNLMDRQFSRAGAVCDAMSAIPDVIAVGDYTTEEAAEAARLRRLGWSESELGAKFAKYRRVAAAESVKAAQRSESEDDFGAMLGLCDRNYREMGMLIRRAKFAR